MDPKLLAALRSKSSPLDVLGFKSKMGISLDVTWFLFKRHILDTIERYYTQNTSSATFSLLQERPGMDIYGCKYEIDNAEIVKCSICDRSVICSKYAPHLEKCLGMGGRSRKKNSNNALFFLRDESDLDEAAESFVMAEADDEYVENATKRGGGGTKKGGGTNAASRNSSSSSKRKPIESSKAASSSIPNEVYLMDNSNSSMMSGKWVGACDETQNFF